MRGLKADERLPALSLGAKHRDEDARVPEVGGGLHTGHGHKANPGILELAHSFGEHLPDRLVHAPHSFGHPRYSSAWRGSDLVLVDGDDLAVGPKKLELLSGEVALRLVEELLRLAVLAGHTGQRQPRPLPKLVIVDLRDRYTEAVLELRLRRLDVFALALERAGLGKVQLDAQDPHVTRAHGV